ncbi:hypothetical protein PV328_009747 [Microctonus aethiopoides]|uniref:G-protein coupled receptors family 2 profile 2 domain-containing protein n=1 Tax=Microctonus aethiopoides TaxID=144406 RepID=A0AA39C736_9HYME|nr:hypothetical protein PV328_009747 [Microctonus aethiopoides]
MIVLSCLLFITISVVFGVDPRVSSPIGTCCPPGKVVSLSDNFTCAFSQNENLRELYDTRNNHRGYENPNRCLSLNSTAQKLSDIDMNSMIPGSLACIDLLYDGKFEYTPFIFYCNISDDDDDNDDGNNDENWLSIPVPRMITLRTCCPPQQVYDIDTRECIIISDNSTQYQVDVVNNIHRLVNNTVEFITIVRGGLKCEYSIVDYLINVTEHLQVLRNGTFQVILPSANDNFEKNEEVLLTEENSCVDVVSSLDLMVVRLCRDSTYCETNACVRKCCGENEAWIEHGCQKLGTQTAKQLQFHRELEKIINSTYHSTQLDILNTTKYGVLVGKHSCPDGMYPVLGNESWHITSRGHIDVPDYKIYEHHEYCMEMLYDTEYYTNGLYPCVCFENNDNPTEVPPLRLGINAALELTSCAFLLVTFLVYVCLPLVQNLHGKTFICHVASLFVAYACLATVALAPPPDAYTNQEDVSQSRYFYKFLGYTMLFAFIACFTWLNVMCFDIWWTFGGLGGAASTGGRKRAQLKRFLIYSAYAWGFALLVTTLAVGADHTDAVARQLRPNIAIDSVWFQQDSNNYGEMIYFIGPISIQLIVNIIFFILTIRHCNRVKAEISRLMTPTTNISCRRFRADRTKLILNIKLFIIMGVSWILEIISYFLNHYATNFTWRAEFFYISDAFNCLQGFLIFILFVLKSKVYYALMHRLGRRQQTNMPASLGGMNLQDPYKVKKSASCSTLTSTYGPINTTPSSF